MSDLILNDACWYCLSDPPYDTDCQACHERVMLRAEILKLRDEVGQVMARERRIRDSAARWTNFLQRRIEKLKANIADEESFIEVLRAENVTLREVGTP